MIEPFEPYERPCGRCDGRGRHRPDGWERPWDKACDTCAGNGVVLTAAGEALLAFLGRHFKINVSAGYDHA